MISVVIPTYNSEEIIKALCDQIQKYITQNDEIVIINDFSSDNTSKQLDLIEKLYPNIKVINLSVNIGQVGATLLGIKLARGTKIVTMDDDFQHDPKFIPTLVNELENSNSSAVVAKWDLDETFSRNYGSLLFTQISSFVIFKNSNFRNTAFRIMNNEMKEDFVKFFISRFWIDPRRLKYKVHQINVDHNPQNFRPYSSLKSRMLLASKHLIFDSYLVQLIFIMFFFKNFSILLILLILFSIFQFLIRKYVGKKRSIIYQLFD